MREAKLAPTLLTVTHVNEQNKPIQIPPRQTAGRVSPLFGMLIMWPTCVALLLTILEKKQVNDEMGDRLCVFLSCFCHI